MRHLVIVESPSKCKTIEKYLGKDYRVIATCGHFRGLHSLEQINRSTFDIQFKNTKPAIVKYLKEEVGIAKSVFLATDDDREGESIAWHICQVCKLPLTTPRLSFHEITEDAIQHAIKNPTTLSLSRVMAQHTRQILDLYIGFTISPLLWKAIQHTLSAGRCQTPALHMIAEQEEKIQQQSQDTCFHVKAYFTNKRIEFCLERPLSREEVEPFLSSIPEFVLEPPETKEVSLSPPPILKTSTFQQRACHDLHLSPKQLMKSAQLLYEHGLMTYMRTDQTTYSDDFLKKIQDYLGNDFHSPRQVANTGAHEGIRITRLDVKEITIDKQTDRVYAFLYKYTLQTCMKPTVLCHKIYRTYMKGLCFTHVSKIVLNKGWMDPVEKDWSSYLDCLKRFHCEAIHADEHCTKQEFHWSEAQLIQHLEKNKIGRPSTYAHIVESLIDKKYVSLGKIHRGSITLSQYVLTDTLEKKTIEKEVEESHKLSLTPLGKAVDEFCYANCEPLFNYPYSSHMEEYLDEIEHGRDYFSFLKETVPTIESFKEITFTKREYPSLHAGYDGKHPLVIKDGRFGYYLEYKDQSISLKEYSKYDSIAGWIKEQTLLPEELKSLIEFASKNEHILLTLDKDWSLRTGKYGPYLFYKTSKMKKPKFYKYPYSPVKEDILAYIQKNIKL